VSVLEQSWLWRRVATFGVLIVAHALIVFAILQLHDPAALRWVAIALVAESVVAYAAYIMGATLTEWAKIAGSLSPNMRIGLGGVTAGETPPAAPDPTQFGGPRP